MRKRLLVLTVLAAGLAAGPAAMLAADKTGEAVKKDMARLQGVWSMAEYEFNGRASPPQELNSWLLAVEGDQYNPGSGENSIEYTIRIDPTLTPKVIDLIPHDGIDRGKVIRGIYLLTDDTFTLCRPLDASLERPAGFTTRPGSNVARVVWKRRKR